MSMHAAELDDKMAADIAMIIADLGNIPLCFVLVALVNNIYQMQLNHVASVPSLSLQKT